MIKNKIEKQMLKISQINTIGLWTMDSGLLDYGLLTMDYGLLTMDY